MSASLAVAAVAAVSPSNGVAQTLLSSSPVPSKL